jgi:hypothetical protein
MIGPTDLHPSPTPQIKFMVTVFVNYKVVQILPGQTVTCLHTDSPGHI